MSKQKKTVATENTPANDVQGQAENTETVGVKPTAPETEQTQPEQSADGAGEKLVVGPSLGEKPVTDEKKEKITYSFPTQSRCPRCRTTDTIATSTQGKIQYRRCLRAICRHTYTVIGMKI